MLVHLYLGPFLHLSPPTTSCSSLHFLLSFARPRPFLYLRFSFLIYRLLFFTHATLFSLKYFVTIAMLVGTYCSLFDEKQTRNNEYDERPLISDEAGLPALCSACIRDECTNRTRARICAAAGALLKAVCQESDRKQKISTLDFPGLQCFAMSALESLPELHVLNWIRAAFNKSGSANRAIFFYIRRAKKHCSVCSKAGNFCICSDISEQCFKSAVTYWAKFDLSALYVLGTLQISWIFPALLFHIVHFSVPLWFSSETYGRFPCFPILPTIRYANSLERIELYQASTSRFDCQTSILCACIIIVFPFSKSQSYCFLLVLCVLLFCVQPYWTRLFLNSKLWYNPIISPTECSRNAWKVKACFTSYLKLAEGHSQ